MEDTDLPYTSWKDKISTTAQLGGIETAVLDNGPGRGTRIAWINTGTGLRYKVVIDRAMDIADAFYNQYGLAWLSSTGIRPSERLSHTGIHWLRNFGGGLLTTCGLSHVGGPEKDAHGERGLHGEISNVPAVIESIIQPDPVAGKMDMSIIGRMYETQIFGPSLELIRTISGTLGQASIRIRDEVTNRGNSPAPHMLLYHLNFGWPLVDEGTQITWEGDWQSRDGAANNKIFNPGNNFRLCPAPMNSHSGSGEEVAFIDIRADEEGVCTSGLYNPNNKLFLTLRFKKEQLPWLSNWQHWARGEYVTGLESGTNPPIGQAKARETGQLIILQPGERRVYELEILVGMRARHEV